MLPMLLLVRNWSLTCMKMIVSRIRPSTDGSAPGSPDRTLVTQPRKASPIERSSTSRAKLCGRSVSAGVEVDMPVPLDALVDGCGREADVAASSGGDQLDDL